MPSTTVLVIDDELQIRRVVKNALSEQSRVLQAHSGREGIDLAAAQRPDLIVLDLGLPDMEGAEVCREIRSWLASPIIVLSARHSDNEKVALLDAGADANAVLPEGETVLMTAARTGSPESIQLLLDRGAIQGLLFSGTDVFAFLIRVSVFHLHGQRPSLQRLFKI